VAQSLEERLKPAAAQLRGALAAIERMKTHDYPPHQHACLIAAIVAAETAVSLLHRGR